MENIAKLEVKNVKIGQQQDNDALTGVTVIFFEQGATASLDVRGSAPGSRETELLRPDKTVDKIDAIVLSGGSAFGLEAGCGVMRFLEEKGCGVKVGEINVPIVCQAILFDLMAGSSQIRPDMNMGKEACENLSDSFKLGNFGAGCGATVGKILGPENAMKSGIGHSKIKLKNGIIVEAIIAVNAIGDVFDETGIIAGALNDDGKFADSTKIILDMESSEEFLNSNTTIGCVITNAKLDKSKCQKVAQTAHNGLAQSISPIHTSMDGDTIFAAATGEIEGNIDSICIAAQLAVKNAVISAVKSANGVKSIKSYSDIKKTCK